MTGGVELFIFVLTILRIVGYAGAVFFGIVTISLVADGEIPGSILSALITAVPLAVAWLTSKKLKKISDAKEEERRWLTPEQFTLLVVVEHEEDEDPRIEEVADRLFEMDNLGAMHEYTIDEVKEAAPSISINQFPAYLIVNDSPNGELAEMLSHVRAQSADAEPLLRFLQEEMWKHEMKLRAGRSQ